MLSENSLEIWHIFSVYRFHPESSITPIRHEFSRECVLSTLSNIIYEDIWLHRKPMASCCYWVCRINARITFRSIPKIGLLTGALFSRKELYFRIYSKVGKTVQKSLQQRSYRVSAWRMLPTANDKFTLEIQKCFSIEMTRTMYKCFAWKISYYVKKKYTL